jgi:hypothetical protein
MLKLFSTRSDHKSEKGSLAKSPRVKLQVLPKDHKHTMVRFLNSKIPLLISLYLESSLRSRSSRLSVLCSKLNVFLVPTVVEQKIDVYSSDSNESIPIIRNDFESILD